MKYLLIIFSFFSLQVGAATNYYVSATGNDANTGTSPNAPWKTIDKVNASMGLFGSGDSILFKRGDVFYGMLKLTKGNLNIDWYGTTGIAPSFTGGFQITGWTQIGANIWEAPLVSTGKLNMVTVNGYPKTIARTPDLDAGNGGYRYYYKAGVISGNMYIVDTADTKIASVGDDVFARVSEFRINRGRVYRLSGDSIFMRMLYSINSSVTIRKMFTLIMEEFTIT